MKVITDERLKFSIYKYLSVTREKTKQYLVPAKIPETIFTSTVSTQQH